MSLQEMLTELKAKQESDADVEALHLAASQKATVELVSQPTRTTVSVALHGEAGELHSRGGSESSAAVIYADLEEGEDTETEHLIQVCTSRKPRAVKSPLAQHGRLPRLVCMDSPLCLMLGICEALMAMK